MGKTNKGLCVPAISSFSALFHQFYVSFFIILPIFSLFVSLFSLFVLYTPLYQTWISGCDITALVFECFLV
jgi:hypothetical protein